MARDSLRISAAQRQRLRNLLRRARETSGGIWHRNRDLNLKLLILRSALLHARLEAINDDGLMVRDGASAPPPHEASPGAAVSIAVLCFLADVLDGHHM